MNIRSTLSLVVAVSVFAGTAHAQSSLRVSGVPDGSPFTVTASATGRVLIVELALEPEWHAYARDVGGGRPVRLTLADDADFAPAGDFVAPGDEHGKLSGSVRLTLPIQPVGDGRELLAALDLQVCDALECLAPMSLEISGEVETVAVLLVVAQRGEREERIAGWLRSRGFEVAVDTYAAASLETCDMHDVVITDSDVFQKHGVGIEVVRGFPRTAAPVVAVGFLGTELVEAHGVAMTSGYI